MRESVCIKYNNATITLEDGDFIITEVYKDATKTYNLTEKLKGFLNVDGVRLQLSKIEEVPSED